MPSPCTADSSLSRNHGNDFKTLYLKADRALYRQKRDGNGLARLYGTECL